MRIIYLCLISALLAACSGDRLFKKEKKYTPLYVYYNPLNYNQNYDFAELFYPDYINYPDDRIKYGYLLMPVLNTFSMMKENCVL